MNSPSIVLFFINNNNKKTQCLLHFISDKQSSFADNFKAFTQTVLATRQSPSTEAKASFLFTTDQIKAITDYFKTRYVSQCHIRPLITFLLNTYDYAQAHV